MPKQPNSRTCLVCCIDNPTGLSLYRVRATRRFAEEMPAQFLIGAVGTTLNL